MVMRSTDMPSNPLSLPQAPRYVARSKGLAQPQLYGIFDTVRQEWCFKSETSSQEFARSRAEQMNEAYREAMQK